MIIHFTCVMLMISVSFCGDSETLKDNGEDYPNGAEERISSPVLQRPLTLLKDYIIGPSSEEDAELEAELQSILLAKDPISPLLSCGPPKEVPICAEAVSEVLVRPSSVKQNLIELENTVAVVNTVTSIATVTSLFATTASVSSVLETTQLAPSLSTTTVYLTFTSVNTHLTTLTDENVVRVPVTLSGSQVDVTTKYSAFSTKLPAFTTKTYVEVSTTEWSSIRSINHYSTMVVTELKFEKFPFTKTATKIQTVVETIREKELHKIMVTETSYVTSYKTVYECTRRLLDALKPWS